ncbi:hypothetical protein HGB25_02870 [Candidatus Saccharibacteria bacterium]|nr:hypothetical protein [Candidatus Saccharibacteria bacterium]
MTVNGGRPLVLRGTRNVIDVVAYLATKECRDRLAARFGFGHTFDTIDRIHLVYNEECDELKLATEGIVQATIELPTAAVYYPQGNVYEFKSPFGADPLLVRCC